MNADQRARRRRVLLILLLVGLGSCGAGKYAEHRSNQRLGFVADQGEVVGVSAHKTSGLWHLKVDFRYEVGERSFKGHESRLLREEFKSEADAIASMQELAPGRRLRVYYNPDQPEIAHLEHKPISTGLFMGVGALWVVLSLLWFLYDRARASG